MQTVDVICVPTRGPGDVSGLATLIDSGKLDPAAVVAIMGKTEDHHRL